MVSTACFLVVRLGLGLDLVSGWLALMHKYTLLRCRCHSPAVQCVRLLEGACISTQKCACMSE